MTNESTEQGVREAVARIKAALSDTDRMESVGVMLKSADVHMLLATLSPDDIRREEVRLTPEKVSNAALLGRFGHHPDPAIDFEIEVQAIVAVHADLTAGLREDERSGFADRIARAMTFRAGGDPISVAAKQTLREVEDALRKPASKPCRMFGCKCFCAPKDRPSCIHYSDDYDYAPAIRSQPSREGEK